MTMVSLQRKIGSKRPNIKANSNFVHSEKQLKSRLTNWGFDVKNLKGDTVIELARTKAKRALENKKSSFRVNRKPVEDRKIDRYLQRNAISEEQLLSMTSPVNGTRSNAVADKNMY
jgi:hypothetical protein